MTAVLAHITFGKNSHFKNYGPTVRNKIGPNLKARRHVKSRTNLFYKGEIMIERGKSAQECHGVLQFPVFLSAYTRLSPVVLLSLQVQPLLLPGPFSQTHLTSSTLIPHPHLCLIVSTTPLHKPVHLTTLLSTFPSAELLIHLTTLNWHPQCVSTFLVSAPSAVTENNASQRLIPRGGDQQTPSHISSTTETLQLSHKPSPRYHSTQRPPLFSFNPVPFPGDCSPPNGIMMWATRSY